ncbi:MAG: acid-activated urea channel [Ruminiclostridium sp.]|nr:acid-activated urea channel [Ruminiclostridium sp.]
MLGVCLLFVGIVLINNGACTLMKAEPKAAAVMNIFTGGLSLVINILNLIQGNYYAAGTGLLFCFTYLFVAALDLFGLDEKPFHIFSVFVAVNAVVFGIVEGITGNAALGIVPDIRWAAIWWLWALLWGTSMLALLGKKTGKLVPVLQISEGIITAWVPGVMMLLNVW